MRGQHMVTETIVQEESLCDREAWREDIPRRDRYENAVHRELLAALP